MTIPNIIQLTGKAYIKYVDEIKVARVGDVLLLLNDDAKSFTAGDYENLTSSGYIKAKVFDGRAWQNINIGEFCQEKENRFSKKQRAIDTAILCREVMERNNGAKMRRTYRCHFTRELP